MTHSRHRRFRLPLAEESRHEPGWALVSKLVARRARSSDEARSLVDEAFLLNPSLPEGHSLLDAIEQSMHKTEELRKRHEEIARSIEQARRHVDASRLHEAVEQIDLALSLAPTNVDARALREQIAGLLEARRRAEEEAHRRAEYERLRAEHQRRDAEIERANQLVLATETHRRDGERPRLTEEEWREGETEADTAAGTAADIESDLDAHPTAPPAPAESPWSPSAAVGSLVLAVIRILSAR